MELLREIMSKEKKGRKKWVQWEMCVSMIYVWYPLVVLSVGGGEAVCPASTISPCLDRDIPPGDSAAGGQRDRDSSYRGIIQ